MVDVSLLVIGDRNCNGGEAYKMTKEEMIKGLDSLMDLIKEQEQLRRDGLIFIFEHNLWKEFLEYHIKKSILSSNQIPEKIYGYTLFELKKIIDFAKEKGYGD